MAASQQARVEQIKQCGKTRYADNKASGKCAHCGERDPYPGMVSCLACRKRFRLYRQRYNFKVRAMKQQGLTIVRCPCRKRAMVLCIQCQAPLCDTCYDLGEGRCSGCLDVEQGAVEVAP
jgi:hypothetical protein